MEHRMRVMNGGVVDPNAHGVKDMTPHAYEPRMPPKRSEVVAQRIVKDIRARGLRPGDVLVAEPEMCAAYGVGRSTLREALRVLELQGVIAMRPGRGGGPVVAAPNSRHLASTMALLMQFSNTTFRSVL
jgi:DNA-binding FadR family transcriptional regulator